MTPKYKQLLFAFIRVGMLGYGGGPTSIPLIHVEAVGKYRWMDSDEFADILAIGNTLPGPIATKMAGYIGYRVAGILGAVLAVLALILPTIFLMIVLLVTLTHFADEPWVQGMTAAVMPIVAVMLGSLTWGFLSKSRASMGWLRMGAVFLVSLVVMEFVGIHPAIWIAGILGYILLKPGQEGQS